jgi:hypothetical protein
MPPTITVEDVEHLRASDIRSVILARHRLVVRETASTLAEPVYTVAGQRVELRLVPGGYTAADDCPKCDAGRSCFRALGAVDAEGTERFLAAADEAYLAGKRAMAR